MELNEKDYKIITLLYLFRVSTSEQLKTLYFTNINSACRRLRQLLLNKYVYCEKLSNANKSWKNVYLLTKKGVYEAREWLERTYDRELPDLSYTLHKSLFRHEILMVDVFVKLVSENKAKVEDLFSGKFIDSRLAPVLPSIFKKKATLRPDARFAINGCDCMLEIDRGTESIAKVKQKIASYQKYFATNPSTKHIVLFLIDSPINWRRLHEIRALSCKYLGQHNSGGMFRWYTLTFADLGFVVEQLIEPSFFENCINKLIGIGSYKRSMRVQKAIFDYQFLPSTSMAAAWIGFRDIDTGYEQFYIVEIIIGGESGALHRLNHFRNQYNEFYNINNGHKIKLILIIKDQFDLTVVAKLYPQLMENLIIISVNELLNGESKVLIGREEIE